jgi:chromosome partitioning protein
MTISFAVANQKGGVGKTTSAVNIAALLAERGYSVLLFDLDPQCNATSGLGLAGTGSSPASDQTQPDIFDLFLGNLSLDSLVLSTGVENLFLVPSSKDLVSLEAEIGKLAGRELILRSQTKLLKRRFDFIFFDCPPSSGLLTLNALGAANRVLIPLQAEYYALEGLSGLISTIEFVKNTYNPELEIFGVFMTMFDGRTNLANQVRKEAENFFGPAMLRTVVPRSVKLSEAPSHGLPISAYDPSGVGSAAYRGIVEEVLVKLGDSAPTLSSEVELNSAPRVGNG